MPLTADNSGRIRQQPSPSGNSMPPELLQIISQSMAQGPGATGEAPANPLTIRLGQDRSVHVDSGAAGASGVPGLDHRPQTITHEGEQQFSTIEDAVNSWYLLDDAYREKVMEKLWYYGLIDGPNNEAQAISAWNKAVDMAWNYAQNGKQVDPLDMLPKMTNLKAGQLGNAPRTITQRSFNALDPAEAEAFIRQSFQAAMGRDPHPAEVRNLIRGLQDGYANNPAVTQQTTDKDGNSTTKVIDPGFDQQAFVANQLQTDPEARAHQAAAELFPALEQAISSPV